MCTPVMTRLHPPDHAQPRSNVDQMPASTSVALQTPAMTFGTEYMTPARTDSINFMIRRQSPPRPSPYNHRGCEDRDDRTAPRLHSLSPPYAVSASKFWTRLYLLPLSFEQLGSDQGLHCDPLKSSSSSLHSALLQQGGTLPNHQDTQGSGTTSL